MMLQGYPLALDHAAAIMLGICLGICIILACIFSIVNFFLMLFVLIRIASEILETKRMLKQ